MSACPPRPCPSIPSLWFLKSVIISDIHSIQGRWLPGGCLLGMLSLPKSLAQTEQHFESVTMNAPAFLYPVRRRKQKPRGLWGTKSHLVTPAPSPGTLSYFRAGGTHRKLQSTLKNLTQNLSWTSPSPFRLRSGFQTPRPVFSQEQQYEKQSCLCF